MKTRWIIATLLLAASAAAAPLRVGGFLVAPIITGTPDAPLRGALREYMEQQLVHGAGIALTWAEPTSLPRAMENLKNGSIDVLLLTTGRPGGLPGGGTMASWSYLQVQPSLAVLSGAPLLPVQSLDQLNGMEIGWVGGSPLNPDLERAGVRWQLVTATDWQVINLLKLQAGRIQAVYFENQYSPRYYARLAKVDIRLVTLPLPARNFMMAYSLKADPGAIARFDQAAARAFAGGQFKAYLEQYMKR